MNIKNTKIQTYNNCVINNNNYYYSCLPIIIIAVFIIICVVILTIVYCVNPEMLILIFKIAMEYLILINFYVSQAALNL